MKKGDVHYIVIFNTGQIEKIDSVKSLFRQDIKLIIKRTFLKKSGGLHLYDYYKNQVLDADFKIKRSNTFIFNKLKCKLIYSDEKWTTYDLNDKHFSVCIILEVKDHLNQKNTYNIENSLNNPFKNMINILEIIDRVGTHQGYLEVRKLSVELKIVKQKYDNLKKEFKKKK